MRSPALRVLLAAALLPACNVTVPWSEGETAPSGVGGPSSVSVSPAALSFSAAPGDPTPPAQVLTVSVTGVVYVDVEWTGDAVASASFAMTGAAAGEIRVLPAPTGSAPSTRSGTVTVIGCADEACSRQVAGSPISVPVTYEVQASTFHASPSSLTFAYGQGAALPEGQVVSLSDSASGSAAWSVSVIHPTGATGWLRISPGSGTLPASPMISIAPQPTIAVGTHTAVAIFASAGGERRVNVTLEVTRPGLAASTASVGFSSFVGADAPPPAQEVEVTASGGAAIAYTTAVTYLTGGTGWLAPVVGGTTPARVALGVNAAATTAGTRTARVTFSPANGGTAASVDVTYTAAPAGIHAAPASLELRGYRGQTSPPSGALALTTDAGQVAFTAAATYGAGATGWLGWAGTSPAPTTLSATASETELAPGQYGATLRVTPANGAPALVIPVTYDVLAPPLAAVPAEVAFTVTAATTPDQIASAVTLSSADGPISWTASSPAAWIAVSPASGASSTTAVLDLSLVPAELAALPNGAHATAVRIEYEVGGAAVALDLPVTLALDLPRVRFASPATIVAGDAGAVILRGEALGDVEGLQVRFGGATVAAPAPASATELRLQPPAGLATGSHLVSVENGLGLTLSRAQVTVVAPTDRAAASVATTGAKTRLLFDDARGAAWAANRAEGIVERFTSTPSGWVRDTVAVEGLADLALSPDGTRVVALGTSLHELDPDAATLSATPTISFGANDWRLAFANDGVGVLVNRASSWGCVGYDFLARRTFSLGAACANTYGGGVGATGDGRRVVVVSFGLSPNPPLGWYDASAGAFVSSAIQLGANWIAADRTGDRVFALNDFYSYVPSYTNGVYDAAGTLLGRLSPSTARAVLSPDGTRAYAYDTSLKIRTYDLTAAPAAGVFPELGAAGGVLPATSPGAHAGVRMAIAADGRTLFLAGNGGFVVHPLP